MVKRHVSRISAFFLLALLAMIPFTANKAFADIESSDWVLMGSGEGTTCVLTNDEGKKLSLNAWTGQMNTEMNVYRKLFDNDFSHWYSSYHLSVDSSNTFRVGFKEASAAPLAFEAHDLDVRASRTEGAVISRDPVSDHRSAEMKKVSGCFHVRATRGYEDEWGSDVTVEGECTSPSDLSVSDSSDRFVLSGLSEGLIDVSTAYRDADGRYYAFGGKLEVAQNWRFDGDESYECTDAKVIGALPVESEVSKNLKIGSARVSSELGGTAAWLVWDEVSPREIAVRKAEESLVRATDRSQREAAIKACRKAEKKPQAASYRVYEKRGGKWKCISLREGFESNCLLVKDAGQGEHRYRVRAFRDAAGKKPLGAMSRDLRVVVGNGQGPANATGVSLSKSRLSGKAGKTARLRASVAGEAGKRVLSRSVCWVSSDPKVAKVDKRGRVHLLKPGTCRVWAVAHDGVESSHAKVTVKKACSHKAKPKSGTKKMKAATAYALCA